MARSTGILGHMANAAPVAGRSETSPFVRTMRVAFRSLASTFLAAGTLATTVWLLGFWSLVVRARLSTGTWPHPSSGVFPNHQPGTIDPKVFVWHSTMAWIAYFAMVYVVPFALLVLIAGVPIKRLRQDRRLAGAFVLVTSIAAVTLFFDPGRFFLWMID